MLGGCDADGVPVYNENSSIIIRAVIEFSLIDPKINIRISKDTDSKPLNEIIEVQSKKLIISKYLMMML